MVKLSTSFLLPAQNIPCCLATVIATTKTKHTQLLTVQSGETGGGWKDGNKLIWTSQWFVLKDMYCCPFGFLWVRKGTLTNLYWLLNQDTQSLIINNNPKHIYMLTTTVYKIGLSSKSPFYLMAVLRCFKIQPCFYAHLPGSMSHWT